jgi:Mn2+/Fe2+ NRAMP family transporter
MQNNYLSGLKKTLGPGILMAGAAIGVSHLVQSTRAGADYGFSLWWVLVLACATKYPFLEFGSRYAAATGENLLDGYKKLGKGAFPVYASITILTMFIILASLTLVTAGMAENLFGLNLFLLNWSIIILTSCILLVIFGKFSGIDKAMKIIMTVLLLLTVLAVAMVFRTNLPSQAMALSPPKYITTAGIAFIIAFMGWMPIPIDASVWQSIWARERFKETGYQPTVKQALADFKIGFYGSALIGVFFFLLGYFVMFGKGSSFPSGSVAFSASLIEMYGQALGNWSRPIIALAAFVAMYSTTLAVVDIYPRVMMELANSHTRFKFKTELAAQKAKLIYWVFLLLVPLLAMIILYFFKGGFTRLIDFAVALSFLSSPVIAYYNIRLLTSEFTPKKAQPRKWYLIISWLFLIFLILFSLLYIYWTFIR